ncbi:MAG: CDP-paratose 2-epimerase [Planctomycetes bacterium]|nr:CDP-paratose 2-epimerase [Planctomycetota bacterium]NOG54851.1 SRPBCC family protein [Planctomycetota bacterium]
MSPNPSAPITFTELPDGSTELVATQTVALPLDQVFPFFADAQNLEALTPPWLHFRIVTPTPIDMRPGTLIDYRLRVHGLPLRWQSEITAWDPPHRFCDEQRRGPYRLWKHTHEFTEEQSEERLRVTHMTDRVIYAVPGGRLVDRLFVRRDLKRIFGHRQQALTRLLADQSSA